MTVVTGLPYFRPPFAKYRDHNLIRTTEKEEIMNDNKKITEFRKWTNSPLFKLLITLLIGLMLLIPMTAIKELMRERENRRDNAKASVINQWGGWQHITGPVLAIPVEEEYTEYYEGKKQVGIIRHYLYVLPDKLTIDGDIKSQIRQKGIFDIELYSGSFAIEGSFSKPEDPLWNIDNGKILWEESRLILGLGDVKGLSQSVMLNWKGEESKFHGGTGGTDLFPAGITASTPFSNDSNAKFNLMVDLKGGASIYFYPLGGETSVSVNSDWVSPGFAGSFIPTKRDLSENGFNAQWDIHSLARNYPQNWIDDEVTWNDINYSGFGIDFLTPIDGYFKSHRAIKYSLLFIFLPFITLFLFEIFAAGKLHPFQYIMIGLTVCMFFLLLLTLSEHMNFNLAYLAAGTSSALLVSFYTGAVFKNIKKGCIMAVLNIFLYIYLYMALASEDFALLIGSLGLFVILTSIMVLTRKINWYKIGNNKNLINNT